MMMMMMMMMLEVCSAELNQCGGDFLRGGDFVIRTKEDLSR